MTTLRERVERLIANWRDTAISGTRAEAAFALDKCATELAAALAAEGQGAPEQEQVPGDKEDSITRRLRKAREEATLAEHKSHVNFENELYATLVDPVAEGPIKESAMQKQLLESARWYRQRVYELETAAAPSMHKEPLLEKLDAEFVKGSKHGQEAYRHGDLYQNKYWQGFNDAMQFAIGEAKKPAALHKEGAGLFDSPEPCPRCGEPLNKHQHSREGGCLLKEGAGGERLTGTQVLAAVNECVDLHGIGSDFPATWVDSNINFNELAESLNRRLVISPVPSLPLQRTLPDEQFKGAVVTMSMQAARDKAHAIVRMWLENESGTTSEQRDRLVEDISDAILGASRSVLPEKLR